MITTRDFSSRPGIPREIAMQPTKILIIPISHSYDLLYLALVIHYILLAYTRKFVN